MGTVPFTAAVVAFLAVAASFLGLTALQVPFFTLALFIGGLGLWRPGGNDPRNGRVLSGFAIIIAFLPFLQPWVAAQALARREAIRAAETAAMYESFDNEADALAPRLVEFWREFGQFPPVGTRGPLPIFGPDGRRIQGFENSVPTLPNDPFAPGNSRLGVLPVGDLGAILISVGQNGTRDFPPVEAMFAMDAQPRDPHAPLAWSGVDLRLVTYDPTNGALGGGDLVRWIPGNEESMAEALRPLHRGWDRVHSLTPPPASRAEADSPPPVEEDARNARLFLDDGEWLASLAAASRAVANRRANPQFWRSEPTLLAADKTRALALFELGHFRTAADLINDYTGVQPRNVEGFYWLGVLYYLGGDHENARRALAAASQISATDPFAARAREALAAIEARRTPEIPLPAIRQAPGTGEGDRP